MRMFTLLLLACVVALGEEDADYLVLVAKGAPEEFARAAEGVARLHAKAPVRAFDPARLGDLLPGLKKKPPRDVCLVVPREVVDVRFVRGIFLLSTKLDDDPFPDFSYGLLTGDDGQGVSAFAGNVAKAQTRARTRSLLQVTTRDGTTSTSGSDTILDDVEHGWSSLAYEDEGKESQLELWKARDVISVFGHGDIGGMAGGYWSTHLDRSCPDLGGAVVISSICYSGVVSLRIGPGDDGKMEERTIDPLDSFALALLRHGAGAYVAGVAEMHGLYTGQVYHAVLLEGASLGEAVRSIQDRMVLEMTARSFPPERLLDMGRLEEDEQVATAANLVVYGDPALTLYPRRLQRPVVRFERGEGANWRAEVSIEVKDFEGSEHVRSKYGADGNRWGVECAFVAPLPEGLDPRAISVPKSNVAAMEGATARFAVETRGASRLLHVVIPFDGDEEAVTRQVEKEGYRLDLSIEATSDR